MFGSPRILSASSTAIPIILDQPALVPISITGTEALNKLYQYNIGFRTPDTLAHLGAQAANYDLDDFIGQELTLTISLEGNGTFVAGMAGASGMGNIGAGTREISGVILDAQMVRQVGRHVHYEITLVPWLYLATTNADNRIFQDKTVVEIIDAVLGGYGFPIEKRLYDLQRYPKRDYTTQSNESDFNFISRLLENWGINYYFEHKDGKHTLTLTDANASHAPFHSEAYHVIRYYEEKPRRIDEEFIHSFSPINRITSGAYTSGDYDYTRPRADLTITHSEPRIAGQEAEVYEYHADSFYVQPKAGVQQASNDPQDEGKFIARMRMERLRNNGRRATGAGHLRGIVPGCIFTLARHPTDKANIAYLVLSATLTIKDIAQESQPGDNAAPYHIDVEFEVVPVKGNSYRPERLTPRPVMHIATAIVVGAEKNNLWTDYLGRIKVQFPWDRLGEKNQNSSCWVRVANAWAGNQLGSMHLPRLGQEVLIGFIDGNPDLPICTGRVHNQHNLPPWSLPDQSALSGIRTRELLDDQGNSAAGRSNHLVFDDTAQRIQAQLKSDHLSSSISLGSIARIDNNAGRKDLRGDGAEVRTDGPLALRGGAGVLVSAEARHNAQGHMTSMDETVQRLQQAREQHETLADLARQGQAQEPDADQRDVVNVIKAQNEAIKGSGGDPAAGQFPELAEPHLVLASPAGMESTTARSTHLASGEDTAITSGRHFSVASMGSLFGSVGKGMRWFVHTLGIKMIAAAGLIEIKALTDMIRLIAQEGIEILSTDKGIRIIAKTQVEIGVEGGSRTVWEGTSINHYAQDHIVNAKHAVPGPKLMPDRLPTLPKVDPCIPCLLRQAKLGGPLTTPE